ncbi:unnamed protein product, partial [marine sediment metagenome]
MERALELDPFNSYVTAFAAQVHYLVNRSYVGAFEFAERSIELNQANPLGWSLLGIAKCYLGDLQSGAQNTRFAVKIAGSTPFRFRLAGQSCIANTISRQFEQAVRDGEASHVLAPTYAPTLRYLAMLYLQRGSEEKSLQIVEELQSLEPDFSYDRLKDPSYPS